MSATAKFAASLIAAASGAVVPAVVPPETSFWSIVVLGIPLSVLAAALAGAAVRSLREPSQADAKIPMKVLGTVADGFVGGWAAMALLTIPFTQKHLGASVPPEVIGALCALLVQFVRANGKGYFDQAYATVLSLFGRKKSGPEAEPPAGGSA